MMMREGTNRGILRVSYGESGLQVRGNVEV